MVVRCTAERGERRGRRKKGGGGSHKIDAQACSGRLYDLGGQPDAGGGVDGIGAPRDAPQQAEGGLQLLLVEFHAGVLEARVLVLQTRQGTAQQPRRSCLRVWCAFVPRSGLRWCPNRRKSLGGHFLGECNRYGP